MPISPPIELKRHSLELSPEETEEVVAMVADLLVGYLKRQGDPSGEAVSPQGAPRD